MRTLYELCGAQPTRVFSAYAWRVRLALGLKELAFESRPLAFTQIPQVLAGVHSKVPVLIDGDQTIVESFDICAYLEDRYPDTPTLFGGQGGRQNAALIDGVMIAGLYPSIVRMIIRDIWEHLAPVDQAYFRTSREARFGASLEDVQRGRDKERERFAALLRPYRQRLEATAFLGGDAPLYADLALASSFCWSKATSTYDILSGDTLMETWFERVLLACAQREALKQAA